MTLDDLLWDLAVLTCWRHTVTQMTGQLGNTTGGLQVHTRGFPGGCCQGGEP